MKFSKLPIIRKILKPYFLLKDINNKLNTLQHQISKIESNENIIKAQVRNIQILTNISSRKNLDVPYTFINYRDTIKQLVHSNASFIRFGDGEIKMTIRNHNNTLQSFHPILRDKLKNIWKNIPFLDKSQIMIGVNDGIFKHYFNQTDRWQFYNEYDYSMLLEFIHPNATYFSSSCCRLTPLAYLDNNDLDIYTKYEYFIKEIDNINYNDANFYKNNTIGKQAYIQYQEHLIKPIKSIWKDRNIITIEGQSTYFGVYNDLLDNTKSITRIYGKDNNAFDDYENLLETALQKAKEVENPIFILALGATATVIGYELHNKGYRSLDLGNFSIQYDIFSGKVDSSESFQIDSPKAKNRIYKG